jgi:phosphonate transport system ATP-binding protein
MTGQLLRLRGLTRQFGSVVAVDRIDLDVPAGQMLGVIGRSGAGKSTLLRMINRLTEPSAGTIRYGTLDVTPLAGKPLREWRAHAAMIFQQFNLVPRLDVLTNVLIGRLSHRATLSSLLGLFSAEERATALALLERFGLAEVALQRAGTLSGGQQQRVAICRALLQEPLMVLADEPIASLDPHNARVVMEALRTVNRQDGLTVPASPGCGARVVRPGDRTAGGAHRVRWHAGAAEPGQGVRYLRRDRGRIPRRPRAAGARVMDGRHQCRINTGRSAWFSMNRVTPPSSNSRSGWCW